MNTAQAAGDTAFTEMLFVLLQLEGLTSDGRNRTLLNVRSVLLTVEQLFRFQELQIVIPHAASH